LGDPATLSDHGWIGVEANRVLEQVSESDGQDAGTAATVEEPSGPIQTEFRGENSLELGRVGRSTAAVMGSGTLVDRRVVPHPYMMPA
jgi:hypothetical protein